MKKKLMAVLLGTVMVFSLAACGGSKAGFTDDDLVFKGGSEEVTVAINHYLYVGEDDIGKYTEYDGLYADDYELYEEALATSRGLTTGMDISEYKDLYAVKNGYAAWELITYDDEGSTTRFDSYTNQSASDVYAKADSAWLDLGWCRENGKWRAMTDVEVMDVWFCDANYSDFGEVVILSVFVNNRDKVGAIDFYHFTYNSDWAALQDWQ